MKKLCIVMLVAACAIGYSVPTAKAFPQFQKQAQLKYASNAAVKKAKCFTCHSKKKNDEGKTSKKLRNAYGKELSKLLDKKDKKDNDKIQAALDTVAKIKSASGKTYGELLEGGELAATD